MQKLSGYERSRVNKFVNLNHWPISYFKAWKKISHHRRQDLAGNQCDQIGRFLQVPRIKLSHIRSTNIVVTFWAISKNVIFKNKMCINFYEILGGYYGTFYSIIWSRCWQPLKTKHNGYSLLSLFQGVDCNQFEELKQLSQGQWWFMMIGVKTKENTSKRLRGLSFIQLF